LGIGNDILVDLITTFFDINGSKRRRTFNSLAMYKPINLIVFSTLLLIIACSPDAPEASQETNSTKFFSDEAELDKLSTEIMNIIKDKSCKTTTAGACKTIAFGAKACGGPKEFLIYNSSQVDESLLIEKVRTFNKLQEEFNKKSGIFSDCMVVIQPLVGCVDGNCSVVQ
jgi:hypothetical protein